MTLDDSLMPTERTAGREEAERIYPCDMCPTMRTKDEGGTVFTVCKECWDKHWGIVPTPAIAVLRPLPAAAPPAGGGDTLIDGARRTLGITDPVAIARGNLYQTLSDCWKESMSMPAGTKVMQFFDRVVAALARRAPEGARRTVLATCECGRGPRSILDFRDSAGVRSWRLATTCTECLPDYTNATTPGGAA